MLISSHQQLAFSRRPTSWARGHGPSKVLKPPHSATSSQTNHDALYTSSVPVLPFVCKRLSLELTDYGGLGFKANAKISAGDLLLTTPPIEAVWAEAGEQLNLDALADALVPYIRGGQEKPTEADWRAGWLMSLFRGTSNSRSNSSNGSSRDDGSTSNSSSNGGGMGHDSNSCKQTSGEDGGQQRFERVQQLLLETRSAQQAQRGQHEQRGQQQQQQRDEERVPSESEARAIAERVIKCNAYGTRAQDFAAAHLRGVADQKLGAFCGVWPVFSIFNHSCAPNTVFFSMCSSTSPERFSSNSTNSSSSSSWRLSWQEPHLVMHAARDIEPGEAVTVTYMGPQMLQPVDVRRSHLQTSYGFECRCPRCCYEAQIPPDTRRAMAALSENAQVAQEAIGEALGPELCGDQELLETAQAALNHVRREFATLCRESGLSQDSQTDSTCSISSPRSTDESAPRRSAEELARLLWIQASYYPLHSPTVADRTELADVEKAIEAWGKEDEAEGPLPADMAIFQGAQGIIQEVAPGSDLHVALAVQSKFCAERLLGALGSRAIRKPKLGSTEQQEEEDGVSEVVAWLQDGLHDADKAAQFAIRSRYGNVSSDYAERLFWLNAAERLPKPLLELCWAYRERRLSAKVD